MTFSENSISSSDNAIISYRSIGNGPGLVVVSGTFRASDNYEQLAQALSATFTVHLMDRRGRGKSSAQGDNYSIATEVADVRAVLEATKSSLVFGHSYGGLIGLELALGGYPLQKLAVYEPAISVDNFIPATFVPEMQAALAKKDYARALNALFKTVGQPAIPDGQLAAFAESMASNPAWPGMCQLLETTPAEIAVAAATNDTYQKYDAVLVDTMVMYGGESSAPEKRIVTLLGKTLPHSKLNEVAGVGHNAPDDDAPEKIAKELKAFFS